MKACITRTGARAANLLPLSGPGPLQDPASLFGIENRRTRNR